MRVVLAILSLLAGAVMLGGSCFQYAMTGAGAGTSHLSRDIASMTMLGFCLIVLGILTMSLRIRKGP